VTKQTDRLILSDYHGHRRMQIKQTKVSVLHYVNSFTGILNVKRLNGFLDKQYLGLYFSPVINAFLIPWFC
jgi:hypothetical protein